MHETRLTNWENRDASNSGYPNSRIGIATAARSNALAYLDRGIAYGNQGKQDEAISDYDEAIGLDPSNALAYLARGIAYGNQGKIDEPIIDYDEAIGLDPSNALAYVRRGTA
jgi:tetratricopeptide (TPR) repeat protein